MLIVSVLVPGGLSAGPSGKASASEFQETVGFSEVRWTNGEVVGQLVNYADHAVQGLLIAALYNESNHLDDLVVQEVAFTEAAQTLPFSVRFAVPVDAGSHSIKLFVWDSMERQIPLSLVARVSPYELAESTANKVHRSIHVLCRPGSPGIRDGAPIVEH
jgi:hypothetical protein